MTKTFIFIFLSLFIGGFARITIPVSRLATPINLTDIRSELPHTTFLANSKIDHTILNKINRFYFGDIVAGQQKDKFTVIFDTGSNDLWLGTDRCTACPGEHKFYCDKSDTCSRTTEDVEIQYGLGYVKGKKGSDMIGFTPNQTLKQTLFLIDEGRDLTNYKGIDGIMGMGSSNKAKDWIDLAYNDGLIEDKVFSFILDNNPSSSTNVITNKSKLIIGYIPEEHVNKLMWVPVTDSNRWSTDILAVRIGDTSITPSTWTSDSKVLLDTGTSFTFLPYDIVKELKNKLSADTYYSYPRNYYLCTEEAMQRHPNLTFYMRGVAWNFTARHYLDFNDQRTVSGRTGQFCAAAFMSTSDMAGLPPILGDAIFRDNLIAFSKRNQTMGLNIPGMVPLKPISTRFHNWIGLIGLIVLIVAMRIANKKANGFSYHKAMLPNQTTALLSNQAASSTPANATLASH